MKPFKFFVITDTHYFAKSLSASGKPYEEFMDFEQKCFAETPYINDAVFDYLAKQTETDTILIAGDLSFNGEKASHEEFSALLKKVSDAGKKIYVVTVDFGTISSRGGLFAFGHNLSLGLNNILHPQKQ